MKNRKKLEEYDDSEECCACGADEVSCVGLLEKRSPTPGAGWGCLVCNLPRDGALYLLCNECMEAGRPPRFACRGSSYEAGRVPIEDLAEDFKHIPGRHDPERECGWLSSEFHDIWISSDEYKKLHPKPQQGQKDRMIH